MKSDSPHSKTPTPAGAPPGPLPVPGVPPDMQTPAQPPEHHHGHFRPAPVFPGTKDRPIHEPETPQQTDAALLEATTVDVPNLAKADFNEAQFVDQGNGWVTVKIVSPAKVYHGPGFPKPGEKYPYHGWKDQSGPVRDGQCWLTIKPGGVIAAQPTDESPAGWQLFCKQDGVIFCVPEEDSAFGFVYKRK